MLKHLHSTQNQTVTDGDLSEPQSGEYAEKLKSISTTDRLSNSVSDYILKVEKQGYSDYAKGFYTSQIDNIAKVFATSSETASLTDIAKREIASLKEQQAQSEQVVQTEEEIMKKNRFRALEKISSKKMNLLILKKQPERIQRNQPIKKF